MNFCKIAYAVHLVIPAFLLSDLVWAWRDGYFAVITHGRICAAAKIVAAVSSVWLVGGAGAFLFTRNRQAFLGGLKRFSVNELGLRGPALAQPDGLYKIIAAGGSTTESQFQDDAEEWPHLLMTGLNARQDQARV